jgi:hypothetical protein
MIRVDHDQALGFKLKIENKSIRYRQLQRIAVVETAFYIAASTRFPSSRRSLANPMLGLKIDPTPAVLRGG